MTRPGDEEAALDSAPPPIPSAADISVPALAGPPPVSIAEQVEPEPDRPQPAQVLPGHVIAGRYEVEGVLGEGGMGIVHRCRDLATGELTAVKRVILPEGNQARDYVLWFYKEARAQAVLDHPCIVRARDFGRLKDGTPFLAMDLAPGVSLHDLSHRKLPFAVIWSICDQVLAALAHAHARGIVHGDLKPSNVLVEEREGAPPRVRILDFGLAWLRRETHDERLDGARPLEFAPHAGAGTPGYMAPEQIQHETHHVSGPTDLYALGCILYKLLSGRAPFTGDSKELLKQHAFDEPPDVPLPEDAPPGVEAFVSRLLEKEPWNRWEFAAAARQAWKEFEPRDVPPEAYRFPRLGRPGAGAEPVTRKSGPRDELPGLALAGDQPAGLLSIRPSPLVGREDTRRLLREVAEDVIQGRGAPHRLVILVGPAGVGKSRIAEWLCDTVHEEGTMVPLRARYRRLRSALDGMVGAVTQHLGFERVDRDTIERSLLRRWDVGRHDQNGRAWVAGAAEWLRPTPPGAFQPVGPSGLRFTLDTVETRRSVIRYTLRRLARGRPLLFWLDDLHHGSPGTFEGLRRIHDEEPDQRILMVATVRSEDVQLGTPAADRLRELREAMNGLVVDVRPLDQETTVALVQAALPLEHTAALEAARRSRGNPLFALQQLHAWALAGELSLEGGVYRVPPEVLALRPETTAELWDSRLAAVPVEHRDAAYAAATLGGEVRREVLEALLAALGIPVAPAVESLQKAEILLPRGPGRWGWPHALLQEHLLGRLGERQDAARMYLAAAEALLAHPLAQSRRVTRQRVVNLLQAGLAQRAAAVLFEHLETAWYSERDPSTALADLDLLKGRLEGRFLALKHRWQAEALRHLGRTDEAITHAEIARASFEELGDAEHLGHSLRLLGHLASEKGQSAEGRALVEQALALFTARGHVLGQAQCEAVLGEIEYLLGNYERVRELVTRGEEHFAALRQPLGRGQCLLLRSWVDHGEGLIARSQRLTAEALAQFEQAGYRLGQAQAKASLAHASHRLADYFTAERQAMEALAAFDALATPRGQAACERLLAMIAIDTDDLDVAELHAERSLALYTRMGDPWGIVEANTLLAQVALGRHDPDRAEALLAACGAFSLEEPEPRQHQLLTMAWLGHERGDVERAFEHLEAAAEIFGQRVRAGDHTPHLLDRLSRKLWPPHAAARIASWRALLNDRSRRSAE